MPRVEIFQGQARRRWSDEDKRRLVTETLAPGATVHGVARRHGVNTSQLFTWRKRFCAEASRPRSVPAVPGFAAVALAPAILPIPINDTPQPSAAATSSGLIEIELPGGGRVRISGAPDPATVTAALQALAQG